MGERRKRIKNKKKYFFIHSFFFFFIQDVSRNGDNQDAGDKFCDTLDAKRPDHPVAQARETDTDSTLVADRDTDSFRSVLDSGEETGDENTK